jgi:signal transduction histidine kinase
MGSTRIESLIAVTGRRQVAAEKGITLDARAAKDALLVAGDYDVLRRANGRIVSNAIKFTPAGGVYVAAMHRPTGEVEISITDSGVGMTATEISSIVEPFHSLSREQEGSGLGVPLAKALITLHNGELEIK